MDKKNNNKNINAEMTDEEYTRLFINSKDFAKREFNEAFAESKEWDSDSMQHMVDTIYTGLNTIYKKDKERELNPMIVYLMACELVCRQGEDLLDRDGIFDGLYEDAVRGFEITEEEEPRFRLKFIINQTLAQEELKTIVSIA